MEMSEDTNTSTYAQKSLTDAKKERKLYEQDALLLNNRIKLLKEEERKTWKLIEETKRKKLLIEQARKRNQEKNQIRDEILRNQESEREKNQKKIKELKKQIENSMNKNRRSVETSKKQAYVEVRNLRDKSVEQKYKFFDEVAEENKKRSKSVKVDHIKQAIRLAKLKKIKENETKNHYLSRIKEEFLQKRQLESKVSELELLEQELIKRLQNTQNIHQQAVSGLELIRKQPMSGFR